MKNLEVELTYTWENEKGKKVIVKASLGDVWFQWHGSQQELSEIMPLTQKFHEVFSEFVVENCEIENEE